MTIYHSNDDFMFEVLCLWSVHVIKLHPMDLKILFEITICSTSIDFFAETMHLYITYSALHL